jgi:hypothetical protein
MEMCLKKEIPQLLPIIGKQVSYPAIRRFCSKCFGELSRKFYKRPKVKWIDYVINFIEANLHIPEEAYGRWIEIIKKEKEEVGKSFHGQTNTQRSQ